MYRRDVHNGDETYQQQRRRALHGALWWTVLFVAFAGVLGTSLLVTPDDIEAGRVLLSPSCPTQVLFGKPCPTCGMTRGFAALGHGRWDEALRHNRGTPVAFAGCVAALLLGAGGLIRSIHAYRRVSPRRTT